MADFSHLRQTYLPAFAELIDQGWQPYDEHLFEAVGYISPPLLDRGYMEALRRYFWPGARTRGRPHKPPIDRLGLAQKVKVTRRGGPAGTIARYLHARLSADVRNSFLPQLVQDRSFRDRQFLRAVIKHLPDEFGLMLDNGPPYRHRVLGEVDFGPIDPNFPPREKALTAAQYVMRNQLALHPPSVRRMANIASEWAVTRWEAPPSSRRHLHQGCPSMT